MDNPAGRLRHWIDRFQSSTQRNEAVVNEVCRWLDLDPNTLEGRKATYRLGAQLVDLCDEVRSEAGLLPDYLHPDMLLSDFPQIESAVDQICMPRHASIESVMAQINPAGHRSLEYLDTFLHTHRPQTWVDDQKRESLIEQVRALIDGVTADPDLTLDVKHFVLRRLEDVERALREAGLTGTRGIEVATDSLIGAMHRRGDMWAKIRETVWVDGIVTLTFGLAAALGAPMIEHALLPGYDAPPAIEQTVEVDVHVDTTSPNGTRPHETEVVDAELVEDERPSESGTPN